MARKANIALLDFAGIALAVIMGIVIAFFGELSFVMLMAVFLVLSVAATRYGHSKKRELGLYEHERSWENVLANGLIPTLCAVASPYIGWGPYVGSLAAITADKFASELGVLGGEPISLFNFKKTDTGKSGAISVFGTLMSFDAGILIGVAVWFLMPGAGLWKIVMVGVVGFIGSMADSIVGVLEERGIGNKATTNAVCALVGAAAGYLLI